MNKTTAPVGHVATSTVQVGKTVYTVDVRVIEGAPGYGNLEVVELTGPRGASLLMTQYIDSENYHAYRTSGRCSDLKDPRTGRVARFRRNGNEFELI